MIIYFEITFIFDLYCNPIVLRAFGKRTLGRVNIIYIEGPLFANFTVYFPNGL